MINSANVIGSAISASMLDLLNWRAHFLGFGDRQK